MNIKTLKQRNTTAKTMRSWLVLFTLAAAFLTPTVASIYTATAHAAPSVNATYINYNEINVTHTYTGNELESEQGKFLLINAADKDFIHLYYSLDGKAVNVSSDTDCTPYVEIFAVDGQGIPSNNSLINLYLKKHEANGATNCSRVDPITIKISNFTAGSLTLLNWVNGTTLSPVGLLPYRANIANNTDKTKLRQFSNFVQQSDESYSNAAEKPKCATYINKVSADHKTAMFNVWTQGGSGACSDNTKHYAIHLGNDANYNLSPAEAPATDASGTTNPSAAPTLECHAGFNPLNWLLCGAVKGMVNIVGTVDQIINSELSVGSDGNSSDPNQIFGSSNDAGQYDISKASGAGSSTTQGSFYDAWKSIRNISLGLMVVAGLVVIIAQAFGTELVDAYTFRKIVPRLIIAAIAITLSWQLLQFFVKLTNDLGYGVRFLIYQPFQNLTNTITGGAGGNAAVNLLGLGALAALGIFGLLSFAATAALAVFIAFIILVLRKIVIIVLIIAAPIALVAYILPNTQNIYKFWWESLSKALLIFPIISAFIAAGRVFSLVSLQNPSAINQFVSFAAYFAPYLLLPAAFKLAGGTLGRLSGMVNDRGRGGFDRLKKFRQNKVADNMAKTKNYSRLSDRNAVTRGLNTVMGAGMNPRNLRDGRAGIRIGRQAGRLNQGAANLKNDAIDNANNKDDNYLLALFSEDLAKEKLQAARGKVTAAEAEVARNGTPANMQKVLEARADVTARERGIDAAGQVASRRSAGTRLQALNALAQTGYQFDSGDAGYDQLQQGIKSITGSDTGAFAAAMDTAQFHLKGAGRSDLGGINHGAGVNNIKSGVRKLSNYARGQGKTNTYEGGAAAWLGKTTVDEKGSTLTREQMGSNMVAAVGSGQVKLKDVAEWHGMLAADYGSATDANKLEIQKQMDAIRILSGNVDSAPTPTTQDEINERVSFINSIARNEQIQQRGAGLDPSQRV